MLVCNVSLRPSRAGITADIAEAATAVDALATGNVVFATLVDDPASVGEIVDAYLGEIMLEAASADTIVDASIPATYTDAIVETMTAADTQDATVVGLPTTVAWDPATVTAVTLSGGNLVATNTGTTSADQGAKVASAGGKSSGKYYFEATFTLKNNVGANGGLGISTFASTYTGMGNNATTGSMLFWQSGNAYTNGSPAGVTITALIQGQVMCLAVDLDNRKIWFRNGAAGNWNQSGTANPATNTGGITIPSGTMVPIVVFGSSGGVAGNVITANFGATTFTGTAPSGFTSGWPT